MERSRRSLFSLSAFLIVLAALAVNAEDSPNIQKEKHQTVIPKSCRLQGSTEQILALWQTIQDHPTPGAYNTLGVLYAAAGRLQCAIPAFELALSLDSQDWESHYNLALGLLREGDRTRAERELRTAIRQKPDSAAVHFALGTLLKSERKTTAALEEFNRVLVIDPHLSEASLDQAQLLMELGHSAAAISTLESALKLSTPEQVEPLQVLLASAYLQNGEVNKGLGTLEAAVATQPKSADAHFALGEFYVRVGGPGAPEGARVQFQEALRLDPSLDVARLALGKTLLSQDRLPEAVSILTEYCRHRPRDDEGFYVLGLAYKSASQLSEASRSFQRTLELNPRRQEARYELGIMLAQTGKTDEAIDQLRAAETLDPSHADTHKKLALLFGKTGQTELAKSERAKYAALKAREETGMAAGKLNEEGNRYLLAGDPEAAARSYRQALQLNSSDAKVHYNLSLALDKIGDKAAEREELLKAVKLDPSLSAAHNQLGLLALGSGEQPEAESRFKKALAVTPDYAEAESNLGVLYNQQGKQAEAAKLFEQAIQSDSKYVKAYVNLGLIMAQQGDFAGAEQQFRNAIQVDPNSTDALTALGMLQTKTGHEAEGLKNFRQAVAINPSSADAHVNLGIALVDQFDRLGGFQEFTQAARLDPNSATAHYNLGRFYFETFKYAEARDELEKAHALKPDSPDTVYFLALIEKQNDELERSAELFRKVVALQPSNADAQYLLGQNLERLGRTSEAIAHWKAALVADPNHSQALFNLAKALTKSHDPEAQIYQKRFEALQSKQQISDRVQQLGNFALEAANEQDWPQAMDQMSQAIQLCGNCSQAAHLHRNLGLFYARTGNFEGAEKELHTVLELSPSDSDAQKALNLLAKARAAQVK